MTRHKPSRACRSRRRNHDPGRRIRVLAACASIGAAVSLAEGAMLAFGIWVNLSSSVPPGIYREDPGRIERGDCVLSCIPGKAAAIAYERGYVGWGGCPSHTAPVGKLAAGIPGDQARIGSFGMEVNGKAIPSSAPLGTDAQGRELSPFSLDRTLEAGEYLLAGATAQSYDSRYFGPAGEGEIKGRIRPLYLF
ncbi:MAG: conjugative transfer signal peptidase TraF [Succinivibrio sp.]